ncbi:MAG: hypothetical protein HRT99_02275 [Mycoplasmatales bacterium]|nr:hypothetical protein [Mycoplasmatales bacterium]
MKKKNSLKKKIYIGSGIFLFLSILVILSVLLCLPLIIGNVSEKKIYGIQKKYIITVDALITTATITLIAINGLGARNSGSATIIRYTFWKIVKIYSKNEKHYFWWYFSLSWLQPTIVLLLTLSTTFLEMVFLEININTTPLIITLNICFLFTTVLFISSLARMYIFNSIALLDSTSFYIASKIRKMDKNIKNNRKIDHNFFQIISYFRGSRNFELVRNIIDFLINFNEKQVKKISKKELLATIFKYKEESYLIFNNNINRYAECLFLLAVANSMIDEDGELNIGWKFKNINRLFEGSAASLKEIIISSDIAETKENDESLKPSPAIKMHNDIKGFKDNINK